MVSIITIYTNAAVIMAIAIVVIKIFTHYMSIATKTTTKFLKIFISLNDTASQNSLASFLINTLLFYSKSKRMFFLTHFKPIF